ncbi:hypothetical protein D9757_014823 [Collybiopsis confluens]|uniref:Uncharacterized protein n=1 Tax=Collybiopsis confluens TaxID=2823264 RepID=A0A8H5CL80_9AGAR|nr:hypothetical protein D9757_014823 [Collybiopsis confluens]
MSMSLIDSFAFRGISTVSGLWLKRYTRTRTLMDEIDAAQWQAAQVSTVSFMNFAGRIVIGLLSDFVKLRSPSSPVTQYLRDRTQSTLRLDMEWRCICNASTYRLIILLLLHPWTNCFEGSEGSEDVFGRVEWLDSVRLSSGYRTYAVGLKGISKHNRHNGRFCFDFRGGVAGASLRASWVTIILAAMFATRPQSVPFHAPRTSASLSTKQRVSSLSTFPALHPHGHMVPALPSPVPP